MPYPESCPECGGTFRNTGTHFTARRSEVGRHVLLELGCQNTSKRYWWNFTSGKLNDEGGPSTPTATAVRSATNTSHAEAQARNGAHPARPGGLSGHLAAVVATLEPLVPPPVPPPVRTPAMSDSPPVAEPPEKAPIAVSEVIQAAPPTDEPVAEADALPAAPASLKEAFIRQLQLDRLTLRQMRGLLMSDDARRSIEVAAGATEATYERLALILFGSDLPHLLGKEAPAPVSAGMSAEERLELQREKARIRARQRRAAIKAARSSSD